MPANILKVDREDLLQHLRGRVYKVVNTDIRMKQAEKIHPTTEDIIVGIEIIEGKTTILYRAFLLFDVPIEMCRGRTGDEIQEMLIPHARDVIQIIPQGTYRHMEYRVTKCELDHIFIVDDILDDVTDETRWIQTLADDISDKFCCEWAKEEDIVVYDDTYIEIKEPCMD